MSPQFQLQAAVFPLDVGFCRHPTPTPTPPPPLITSELMLRSFPGGLLVDSGEPPSGLGGGGRPPSGITLPGKGLLITVAAFPHLALFFRLLLNPPSTPPYRKRPRIVSALKVSYRLDVESCRTVNEHPAALNGTPNYDAILIRRLILILYLVKLPRSFAQKTLKSSRMSRR